MAQPFLYGPMVESNEKYSLEQDLSEFEPTAPPPSVEHQASGNELADTEKKGHDSDYDDDFEDYSEPEDAAEEPKSALSMSVANLKLGVAAAAAPLSPVAEAPPAAAPEFSPDAGASTSNVSAKADGLRKYLREQMAEAEYVAAYDLVRSAGEVPAEQ